MEPVTGVLKFTNSGLAAVNWLIKSELLFEVELFILIDFCYLYEYKVIVERRGGNALRAPQGT